MTKAYEDPPEGLMIELNRVTVIEYLDTSGKLQYASYFEASDGDDMEWDQAIRLLSVAQFEAYREFLGYPAGAGEGE